MFEKEINEMEEFYKERNKKLEEMINEFESIPNPIKKMKTKKKSKIFKKNKITFCSIKKKIKTFK